MNGRDRRGSDASAVGDAQPGNTSLQGFRVSRRRFLQASAATPVALSAAPAMATARDLDERDLNFAFDAARRTVTVTAMFDAANGRGLTATDDPIRWTLDAHRFGPDAQFFFKTISAADGAKAYELRIDGGRFGEVSNARLSITFTQLRHRASGKLRFGVAPYLTLFRGSSFYLVDANEPLGVNTDGAGFGVFREVARGMTELSQAVFLPRIERSFDAMFNGLLRLQKGTEDEQVNVVLHRHLTFSITPRTRTGTTPLSIASPSLPLSRITFGWMMSSEAEQTPQAAADFAEDAVIAPEQPGYEPDMFELMGQAERADDAPFDLRGGKGPSVALNQLAPSPALKEAGAGRGVLILKRNAQRADGQSRAEAVLPGEFTMNVARAADATAGPFRHLAARLLLRSDKKASGGTATLSLSFDGDFRKTKAQRVDTPIGTMVLRGRSLSTDETAEDGVAQVLAAFTDPFAPRWGQNVSAVWSNALTPQGRQLDWLEVNMLLLEHVAALPDADYSRLTFAPTDLRILWAPRTLETDAASLVSTVRLGPPGVQPGTRIDLSRATLRASRGSDLVSLGFRFDGLWLAYGEDARPELVKDSNACAAPVSNGGSGDDARPLIAIDFPGQHLFEEALYLPRPEPLPDVDLELDRVLVTLKTGAIDFDQRAELQKGQIELDPGNAAQLDELLRRLPGLAARKRFRTHMCRAKRALDGKFDAFQGAFWKASGGLSGFRFPPDQRIYMGPIGLDVDARALAHSVQRSIASNQAEVFLDNMLDRVKARKKELTNSTGTTPEASAIEKADSDFSSALVLEGLLEQAIPAYQLFRSFYRDMMIANATGAIAEAAAGDSFWPKEPRPEEIEFIIGFRDGPIPSWTQTARLDPNVLKRRFDAVEGQFISEVLAHDEAAQIRRQSHDGLMEGRLANPSRLAFRVSCRDWAEVVRAGRTHLDQPEEAQASLPRAGLDFTLAALTNFADFELAVTRRAERVYSADEAGRRDRLSRRTVNVSPGAMLDHLGFHSGPFVTAATRLADIQSALSVPPGAFETAIEMPARLVLSPHQDAIVIARGTGAPPEQVFAPGGSVGGTARPVWTADFMIEAEDPGLRAVHSPDLRSEALWGRHYGNLRQTLPNGRTVPIAAPPTRGPVPPWFYGKGAEPVGTRTATQIGAGFDPLRLPPPPRDGALPAFALVEPGGSASAGLRARLAAACAKLIEEGRERRKPPRDAQFRTALDAFDRHELVMLTSGWGLPVLGRRGASGGLVDQASQVEPEPRHRLLDVAPGSALYDPRPLEVTELSLSALGGTLRHDSSFEPPAAALSALDDVGLFDALSIERWQQWTVLSRDIFSEVTYKGFLYPLGHRASLVKVTQREFLRAPNGSVRSYLRQRKFIRIGRPDKRYPAIYQPFEGRMFPVEVLSILTAQTPDIVDPESGGSGGEVGCVDAQGRIKLTKPNALAFWPRTAPLAEANIRFEMELDGTKTELPLIFVDNVAANDRQSLAELQAYYNNSARPGAEGAETPSLENRGVLSPDVNKEQTVVDPVTHLRTLRLGGEKRRYAPEQKAGSTSIETDHWTLAVSGRYERIEGLSSAPGAPAVRVPLMGNFTKDPVLEGADQPPFYPLIETARVRLRQAERLVGRSFPPMRARFDFAYLQTGFPEVQPDEVVPGNASELFLNFVSQDQVRQDMGNKGDQSGGVFRPSGYMVGFSRARGVISSGTKVPIPRRDGFAVLAAQFDHGSLSPAQQAANRPDGRSGPLVGGRKRGEAAGEAQKALKRAQEIYSKIFDDDAKILGLVSLKDLMEVLEGLDNPKTGMPALDEQVRYGAGQLQQGIAGARDQLRGAAREVEDQVRQDLNRAAAGALDEAADAADLVRLQVVKPLAEAVVDIRGTWDELETQLARQQGIVTPAGITPITIAEIFPELDSGLTALGLALTDSAEQTDQIAFALSLGAVYEAGRRFIDALKRSLANPVARIEGAFRQRFDALTSIFKAIEEGVPGILRAMAGALLADIRTQVSTELPKALFGDTNTAWRLPVFRVPRLERFAELGFDLPGIVDEVRGALSFQSGDARGFVAHFLHFALEEKRLRDIASGELTLDELFDAFLAARVYPDVFQVNVVSGGRRNDPVSKQLKEKLGGISQSATSVLDAQVIRAERLIEAEAQRIEQTIAEMAQDLRAQARAEAAAVRAEAEALVADLRVLGRSLQQDAEDLLEEAVRTFVAELAFIFDTIEKTEAVVSAFGTGDVRRILDAVIELLEVFGGPLDVTGQAACDRVNEYLDPVRKIALYFNPAELVLSDPRTVGKPFTVKPTDLTTQSEPPTADLIEFGQGTLPSKDAPATHLYTANAELVAALGEAYQGRADALRDFADLPNDVPSDLRKQLNEFVGALDDEVEDVLEECLAVNAALVSTYTTLVAADERAIGLRARLAGIAAIDACGNLSEIDAQIIAAGRLPRDVEAYVQSYTAVLEALEDGARSVVRTVRTLLDSGTLLATAGTLAGVVTAANALDVPERFKVLKDSLAQKAKACELRLHRLESRIAVTIAGVLRDVIRPIRAQAENAEEFAKQLDVLADDLAALIDVEGLGENIDTLAKLTQQLQTLEDEVTRIAGLPVPAVGAEDPERAKLADLTEAVDGIEPLEFVTVSANADRGLRKMRELAAEVEVEFQRVVAFGKTQLRRVESVALTALDPIVRDYILNAGFALGGDDALTLPSFYADVVERRADLVGRTPEAIATLLTQEIVAAPSDHHQGHTGFTPGVRDSDANPLKLDNDALKADAVLLALAADKETGKPLSDPDQRRFLRGFVEAWANDSSAPLLIGAQVKSVVSEILRGDIMRFIDLAAIRAQIEDYLLSLVPSEIQMRYNYGVPLGDPVRKATGGIFAPGPKTRLDVRTGIVIKLDRGFQPTIDFSSAGTLGPFDVKLVGDTFDALTLRFKGARFETKGGSKPRFDITYDDYVIGPQLEFVQDLQSILSPGEGSGAFIKPRFDLPGVEAGYSMNLGVFSIGVASFFNIALRTSAVLPFGPGDARFRAGLSSRTDPFTISYLPFGGSGFFAIEANTDGIVGFEAQFEFGGAAAFGFGPLTGQGRLMSGVYVRQVTLAQNRKLTEITGTFYVGGSAKIWIFNFGASLFVRLGMVNGDMSGEAIFTYSFSIGFKDFDFSVTVWKEEGKGFEGQSAATLIDRGGTRFAGTSAGTDVALVETEAVAPDEDFSSYLEDMIGSVPYSRDYF